MCVSWCRRVIILFWLTQFPTLAASPTFEQVNAYPHDENCFTQGLEFYNSTILLESCGLWKKSEIRAFNFPCLKECENSDCIKNCIISRTEIPACYFAEGFTVVDNLLYLLTYKGNIILKYSLSSNLDFNFLGVIPYPRWEGWGITYDKKDSIYTTSGSEYLVQISASALNEEKLVELPSPDEHCPMKNKWSLTISKRHQKKGSKAQNFETISEIFPYITAVQEVHCVPEGMATKWLNELEMVGEHLVAANIFYTDVVVFIDPLTGNCAEPFHFERGLETNVMNGIAIQDGDKLFLTGRKR
eukprot:GHVP01067050.1.p1 GENE.GHVP01067050.1~~GHVP01067050.1.p1  ORF type:complete len:301 (+),score=44.04 GHVP01067050.1:32-934(+)